MRGRTKKPRIDSEDLNKICTSINKKMKYDSAILCDIAYNEDDTIQSFNIRIFSNNKSSSKLRIDKLKNLFLLAFEDEKYKNRIKFRITEWVFHD